MANAEGVKCVLGQEAWQGAARQEDVNTYYTDYKGQPEKWHSSNNNHRDEVAVAGANPQKLRTTVGKCHVALRAERDRARGMWNGACGMWQGGVATANMCHEPFKLITGINLGRKNYALTLSGCHLQHELELACRGRTNERGRTCGGGGKGTTNLLVSAKKW